MWKRLESMDGVFNEGDKVKVKLVGVDPKTGKFKLSRKALIPKPESNPAPRPSEIIKFFYQIINKLVEFCRLFL